MLCSGFLAFINSDVSLSWQDFSDLFLSLQIIDVDKSAHCLSPQWRNFI